MFPDNCVHDKHGDHFFDCIWFRLNSFQKMIFLGTVVWKHISTKKLLRQLAEEFLFFYYSVGGVLVLVSSNMLSGVVLAAISSSVIPIRQTSCQGM